MTSVTHVFGDTIPIGSIVVSLLRIRTREERGGAVEGGAVQLLHDMVHEGAILNKNDFVRDD